MARFIGLRFISARGSNDGLGPFMDKVPEDAWEVIENPYRSGA